MPVTAKPSQARPGRLSLAKENIVVLYPVLLLIYPPARAPSIGAFPRDHAVGKKQILPIVDGH
jgi:hypothetical protein